MKRRLLILLGLPCLVAAAPVMTFTPLRPRFEPAAQEYRQIWADEGERMIAAMEAETGLAFPDPEIAVTVYEGVSWTGLGRRPMRMRASYSTEEKRGALVHELGHRLVGRLPRPPGIDHHRLLNLFLYDVWTELYGRDFADRMVRFERSKGRVYRAAWDWALAMTREQRRARLQALRTAPRR